MYKEKFIRSVEEALVCRLTQRQLEMVIDEIIKALSEYDVIKGEHSLITYENINEELIKRFCACLLIEGKSEKTAKQYKYTIDKLCDICHKHLPDTGVFDIRLFLAHEKQRGISNRSLENTRANLSAFFQWMLREDIITKNPCMNIAKIKYVKKVKKPFSTVDIDNLRMACKSVKERALIEVLLSTGVRASEFSDLKISDIDFNSLSVKVRNGKGAKERTTFMNDLAKTHLTKYLSERGNLGEYLFYSNKKRKLSVSGIEYIVSRIAERAGVENAHPHRFRRTFASSLASRGMDVQEIQILLGHEDINTTMEYVYTSEEKVQNSYRKYTA